MGPCLSTLIHSIRLVVYTIRLHSGLDSRQTKGAIALVIRLVPDSVLADCRAQAQETFKNGRPVSRVAGAVIVVIWLALAALCIVWAYEAFLMRS
jgi:hypothetical protein